MRLLEFTRDAGGANPRRTAVAAAAKPAAATRVVRPPAGQTGRPGSQRFPPKGHTAMKPARRNPVDLEALQSRIHTLEQRVQQQTGRIEHHARVADLDTLQMRIQRVEQTLNSELWAARQREHTMLEMLSTPPLKTAVLKRFKEFWQTGVPAIKRWLQQAAASWWRDTRPGWWPQFAAAWQEALDQARR